MAYYPHLRPGEREKIVKDAKPNLVAHLSIKPPNMLLDMLHPTDDEHSLTPLIKVRIKSGRRETEVKNPLALMDICFGTDCTN